MGSKISLPAVMAPEIARFRPLRREQRDPMRQFCPVLSQNDAARAYATDCKAVHAPQFLDLKA